MYVEDQETVHTREGDTVCKTCGIVMEAFAMDQSPEWYDETTARGMGPGRDDMFLGSSNGAVFTEKKRYTAPDPHKTTRFVFREIERCAGCLGIGSDHLICQAAKGLFADYAECRKASGRSVRECERPAAAACAIYYGCKSEKVSRTIKEISSLCGVVLQDCTDLAKSFKHLLAEKHPKLLFATVNAGDLLVRAVSCVEFESPVHKNKVLKRSREIFETISENDLLEGRTPETVCSAVIFRACELEDVQVTKKMVYTACAVSNVTLNKALKDLKMHV